MIKTKISKTSFTLSTLSLAMVSAVAVAQPFETIGTPSSDAIEIFSTLQNDQNIVYINATSWLDDSTDTDKQPTSLSLQVIENDVINKGKKYFIDFSDIENDTQKVMAKQKMSAITGMSFNTDLIAISEYKGALLYTLLESTDDSNISKLDSLAEAPSRSKRSLSSFDSPAPRNNNQNTTSTLPHVAFYINVNRAISDSECTFNSSHFWDRGTRVFCDNPNISLIYRVNLERSLQHGTIGSATPDAKIVRISLDEDSTGAGIHLNDCLDHVGNSADYTTLDAWFRDWATDAIAQDYQFAFKASNDKAAILKTFPINNLNANYEKREVSGFELGVSGGVEVGKEGPKGKLEASASYSQSRWLTYNTSDYRVERSAPNARQVSFKWNREQYATAESLQDDFTDALWATSYPVDVNRVNPIGYASFIPNMDVIYKAEPTTTGTTEFTIDSSVNIRPIYNGGYKHYYVVGSHVSYQGLENTPRKRVSKSASFTVNWEHPVFTGGRPVNIQLGGFANRCLESDTNGVLSAQTCNNKKSNQSFIYDQLGRYMSAANTHQCLDSQNLTQLQTCNESLTQRWDWIANSDKLSNTFDGQVLAHDKSSGDLALYVENSEPSGSSSRTITSYTDVFRNENVSPVFGYTTGNPSILDNSSNQLYIAHGAAIDAIGTQPNNLVGGNTNNATSVDLSNVVQIKVYSGEFTYGGKHILALEFVKRDGSIQTFGAKTGSSVGTVQQETLDVPAGSTLQSMHVWSGGWLVDGLQFKFS
ncbi:leukocidin family pore-forming toxin [Photobacterium profundum]|uniref:leukocidin family pore-forming toxin n=1 Tax=Photobacterium profundum TaxID=74109 RepID=UPI003D1097E6